ncbi:MAG: cysteine desulfurase CsdA [Candidatus Omnitrophica bacterium CG11_big_fil_rev_8_21_14_0_20_45_26]|uniref:Cysteine desulfurase n=1 Tax=Candidatus Abzuiibacterium crystallinum TaxID=1974748 RepID=A0A2H0LQJ8_9BACT|nr:MAG: cysteine desulfurase CsdA [Candidatus Omnitrophica bacterium CG11_big_fil_rev_8_21_14_0_20_45_26]PIW65609.1 MAG: cysteine desulfurase CsdA [Candidatus Omnitrophica bacterium CG12_big_fil_rev_8_21_14_0_65_45_16]
MTNKIKTQTLDINKIREDFPVLAESMNRHPLVYLDNAATSQKPKSVINRMHDFYSKQYATVHRGVYTLSQNSTWECDLVRNKCREFLNARDTSEIIFVRGTTEAINLAAFGYVRKFLKAGDEIIISEMEHHANIVPWQLLSQEKGFKLKVVPVSDDGELLMDAYQKLLTEKTKLVAITHISNALGTVNPIKQITHLAHQAGAKVFIDGAQGAVHLKVDVQDIGCDFYAFSGHKIYGPTGIGVLYAKRELLEAMDPYQGGGEMIELVTFEKTTFAKPPLKFEAGTPAIVETIGLGPALDYVMTLGFDRIEAYEQSLLKYATEKMSQIEGLTIIGRAKQKDALVSFTLKDIHPHDIGTILDQEGIAIRTGHHCAQPIMRRFGLPATARASFAFYNTKEEIDKLVAGIEKVKEVFA